MRKELEEEGQAGVEMQIKLTAPPRGKAFPVYFTLLSSSLACKARAGSVYSGQFVLCCLDFLGR